MKKIFLIAVLTGEWMLMAHAQDNPSSSAGGKVYAGVEFLPTFSHFNVSQTESGAYKTNFLLGYGFGGFLGVNCSDHFAVQGEVLYSALAQKYTDPSNIERKIDLDYINVPLLAVFNTNINKPVNLNLVVGPQIGINVGAKVDAEGSAVGDTVSAVVAVKTGDLGFAYGAGVDFGLGSSVKLSIGYRGVFGLIDISDNSQTLETNQYYILDKAHVATYAAYVGLRF